MNFLTYLFNSTKIPFEAPDNWQDVPFKTFVAYNKLIKDGKADDQAKVYSLFMPKVKEEYWNKAHGPKLYQAINEQLNFISTEPSKEVPTHVIKDGYKLIRPKSIDDVTVNEYWGTLKAVDEVIKGKGDNVTTLEVMPEMIAILMFKETDSDKIERLSKEISELPTDKVYGLGCFFLQKLQDLKSGTTITARIKRLMRLILTLVMAEFLIIMVILFNFITFRKGCLVSVKEYLRRRLLKCTLRYKYLLIFRSVKGNIQQ